MQDFAGISDISSSLVRSFWSSLVFSELKFASWTNLEKPPKSQLSCFPQLVLQERGSFIEFWELSFCFQQSTISTWLVSFCERNGFSGKSFRKKRHQQLPRSQHPAGYYGSIMLHCRAILHRLRWGKEMSSNCPTYICAAGALFHCYPWTLPPKLCRGTYIPIDRWVLGHTQGWFCGTQHLAKPVVWGFFLLENTRRSQ